MAVAIKMDELLVSWLASDSVYENVIDLIDGYRAATPKPTKDGGSTMLSLNGVDGGGSNNANANANANASIASSKATSNNKEDESADGDSQSSPRGVVIPPFYPRSDNNDYESGGIPRRRRLRRTPPRQHDTWDPLPEQEQKQQQQQQPQAQQTTPPQQNDGDEEQHQHQRESAARNVCVRDLTHAIYAALGEDPPMASPQSAASSETTFEDMSRKYVSIEPFVRITKEVCRFPSFFNRPLYQRILQLWNKQHDNTKAMEVVTFEIMEWFWKTEMEPYDESERFFRLVKQVQNDYIVRDDFLPFIKALLQDHPGLEFLSNHAEFQEKYAVTVITRIFYSVNTCHSGRITSRQVRRSDLLEAFHMVDEEEDINKVTRYFSYEHFYVLYCRFWELDHDRDYKLTREDLLKYGDHSLSHMIVDRIFDAAPRPFEDEGKIDREYLSYKDFIYFMLSEEDKSNEVSVRYWFSCVDVDGDGKLNNMEMRSFYAVQLHRMTCMGHEIVPFEDMLCQMMDMIKPKHQEYLVAEDFLQPECAQVSGALFDALFNLNKYLLFEQRDPFVERQKREDEFETDWDRFACIDYNRLAMEEEAREEEAMEIDWVTVDDEDDDPEVDAFHSVALSSASASSASSEAPF